MRQVTKKTREAFMNRYPARSGNTHTDGNALFLHGNKIAEWRGKELWITLAGWPSPITRERLHGLPGVSLGQRKHRQYLNNAEWSGDWTRVS